MIEVLYALTGGHVPQFALVALLAALAGWYSASLWYQRQIEIKTAVISSLQAELEMRQAVPPRGGKAEALDVRRKLMKEQRAQRKPPESEHG